MRNKARSLMHGHRDYKT